MDSRAVSFNLWRITSPPLVFMVLAITAASAISVNWERASIRKRATAEAEGVLAAEVQFVSNEIYLRQAQALNLRIQSLREQLSVRVPNTSFCLGVEEINRPVAQPLVFETCSENAFAKDLADKKTVIDITVGDKVIGHLWYSLDLTTSWASFFPWSLIFAIFAALIFTLIFAYFLNRALARKVVRPLLDEISAKAQFEGIALAVQKIAHDIRKPFSVARVALQQIQKHQELSGFSSALSMVDKSAAAVEDMLNDLLQVKTGGTVHLVEESLNDLLIEALTDAHDTFGSMPVIYERKHNLSVLADRARLKRVLINIIQNGFEIASCTELRVRTKNSQSGGHQMLHLEIESIGTYIETENLERVFQPFYTHGKSNGTGLGLAICKQIIGLHNGKIWCENSEAGPSTTLVIELPAGNSADLSEAMLVGFSEVKKRGPSDSKSYSSSEQFLADETAAATTLIIEDDLFLCESWRSLLGTAAAVVSDPKIAMQWTIRDHPALKRFTTIIVDYYFDNAPDLNGELVARHLRTIDPSFQIYLSSDAGIDLNSSALRGVFNAGLPKDPLRICQLLKLSK